MKELADLNLVDYDGDALGDAYEYLIGQFASESGKKAGEFYTPQQVARLMTQIVLMDPLKGTLYKKGITEAEQLFSDNGKVYISYVK